MGQVDLNADYLGYGRDYFGDYSRNKKRSYEDDE